MLIDKYLEHPHFAERHKIEIQATPQVIFPAIRAVDFSRSKVIRLLFTLRGLPRRMCSLQGLIDAGFTLLEERADEEIVVGLLFRLPTFWPKQVSPDEFRRFDEPGHVKAVMTFYISAGDGRASLLSTESRVYCTSAGAKLMFMPYWLLISRFSGLIRIMMLRLIRDEAEKAVRGPEPCRIAGEHRGGGKWASSRKPPRT